MSRPPSVLVLLAGCLLAAGQSVSTQNQGRGGGFGRAVDGAPGRRAIRVERPADSEVLSGPAALDALQGSVGQAIRERGENPDDFAALLVADESVALAANGMLVWADAVDPAVAVDPAIAVDPADAGTATAVATITGAAPLPVGLAANGLPLHHSKPGAPWTIYLDFESRTVPVSQAMRFALGLRVSQISTTGLTLDGDATTFTVDEQEVISRTWGRVAEDWAPFDVDVTTERPVSFATQPFGASNVIWNLITRNESALGFRNGTLYGIAAAANLCSVSSAFAGQPAFTFWGTTGPGNHSDLADTISHESGHVVGLVHDGVLVGSTFQSYYVGHGTGPTSWAPIMGSPINRNVTQWSAGGYPDASNGAICGGQLQDDVLHLARTFGRRPDETGNTIAEAATFARPTAGVIGETTDVDVYALPRADDVRIQITPFRAGDQTDGGNLDVAAEIVNAAGLVVARADHVAQTTAELVALLPPGPHYLRVEASADPANYPLYGSLGQYTVTGTFISTVRLTEVASPLPTDVLTPGRTVPVKFTLSDTVSAARVQLWSDQSSLAAAVLAEAGCQAQSGLRQHCTLKLPKTLDPGRAYWIAVQFESIEGPWVTAQVVAGAALANPLAFTAR